MITRTETLKILEEEGIRGGVLRHSFRVNQIAMYLAKKLISKGEKINLRLLDSASLLHDVGKKLHDETEIDHVTTGVMILKDRELDNIAEIVRKHSINAIVEDNKIPTSWEEKLVYYADKRSKGDQLVSLDERIENMKKRYPKIKEFLSSAIPKIKEIEDEIFDKIEIDKDLEELKD